METTTSYPNEAVERPVGSCLLVAAVALAVGLVACSGGNPGGEPCAERACGVAEGKDCGSCPGATEYCDGDGQCVDGCAGRECGPGAEGVDCGACQGATEVCDAQGQCEDVCAGRECGEPVAGISCGSCVPPRECGLAGNCYAPGGCPPGAVEIPGQGYCIDPYEATNARYIGFLQDHGNHCLVEEYRNDYPGLNFDFCHPEELGGSERGSKLYLDGAQWVISAGYEDYPATHVTLGGARLACEHWGGHLCKLQEWEQACMGQQGLQFPYGDVYDPQACNACFPSEENGCTSTQYTEAVGAYPGCEGGFGGIFDMSGNVREWVDHCVSVSDTKLECILKGGPWSGYERYFGCYLDDPDDYQWDAPWDFSSLNGFRCCYYPD